MGKSLQIGDQILTGEELIPLLEKYQLLPQLAREIVVDRALEDFDCTAQEREQAYRKFCQQQQIETESARQEWLKRRKLTPGTLDALVERSVKIDKFKEKTWGHQLESYFLQRKAQFDKVIYSLLRTKDAGVAQELYCRLLEEEASFEELARDYSQGPEAKTGGKVGPVELSNPHPTLAKMLAVSEPGQLWPPTRLSEWFVLVRLEESIPAQLDEAMRSQLLNEKFNQWVQEQGQNMEISEVWGEDRPPQQK
ncbi:MAG: peptidylprolyl isomerase [Cyanobacteriota bacterium]|nr:peptidylprolyl isomerase [Cyanobacteriota bacterium]